MQLEDRLKICLLAVESRYPDHVMDINEAILGSQEQDSTGWCTQDIIDYLELVAPELLFAMARLIINIQKSEIYLLDYSEEQPAFLIHCRGKIPSRQLKTPSRQLAEA